ncbi:hypothetical protein [Sphingomonas japonica]|uniref:EF-hand domain-containing protein n=1 Tax=Sphingomonas japonica TaxID=511662 RepID=A0ABX0U657_9SPHN|nr:hypothetical protein [Sphingomonas japonica]NIJ25161.1 hypothetical protein [Sphingomonas japonica]
MDTVTAYQGLIAGIVTDTGWDNRFLHLNAGLLVLFIARLATRRPLATMMPLAVVIVAELANEVMDRLNEGSWRLPDTAQDIWITLFWPVCLSLAAWVRTAWPGLVNHSPDERPGQVASLTTHPALSAASVKSRGTIAACGALLVVVAAAIEITEIGGPPVTGPRGLPRDKATYLAQAEKRFEKLDTNDDQLVSPEEIEARRATLPCNCSGR